VNAKRDMALIRDKAVAASEFAVWWGRRIAASVVGAERRPYLIYHCDFVPVNLLRGDQRPFADADCIANFAMGRTKPVQNFGFIVRNIDTRNSSRENVPTDSNRVQCGKLFER